jgi:hypothetical protein
MEHKSEGICRFCLKTFSGSGMGRHLSACKTRREKIEMELKKGRKKYKIYHLKISSSKWYWLHVEIPATATLAELDDFLRGIWLECCGHLSAFTIQDRRYENVLPQNDYGFWGPPPKSMNARLYMVLDVNDTFSHEYDFGSTTYLDGKVLAVREGNLGKNRIRILARNNPYIFACDDCGKESSYLCVECDGFVCEECLEMHECGEEMILDVVNSPRMGECGYSGPDRVDDWAKVQDH